MGAAAADNDTLNGSAAMVAGLAGALEDGDGVLHVAFFAVGFAVAVYAGPFALDAEAEDFLDGGVEGGQVGRSQGIGRLQGVKAGVVERFVGINVADAGNEGLFQQKRLKGAGTAAQTAGK